MFGVNAVNFSIVPTHLAVKAMRDNGYRNTAYAIAELMDNAIQAGATEVELLCGETAVDLQQRRRMRVDQIAILDNGSGMDAEVLRLALQFGNGTRLSEDKQTGIGRFGMGLPASSISQCRRVEVWSWQNGIDTALYTYLDLDAIVRGEMSEVPSPVRKSIPSVWYTIGKGFSSSGTLVVWSDLDRLVWKTARTIIDNSEFVIGRMYRRFLKDGSCKIRLVGFDLRQPTDNPFEKYAQPNDPGYLMEGTSTPKPFDTDPMFEKFGDDAVHQIAYRGKHYPVRITYSIAKNEARAGRNPGSRDHGKHAAKNVGVSVVRAGRELELDQNWTTPSDPRERWWGVEVEFPPGLDELFGVTNNKQHAHNFSELAKLDFDELLKGGRSLQEVKEQLEEEEDPRGPLLEIAHQIERTVNVLRGHLRAQTASEENNRRQRHNVEQQPENWATQVTRQRQEQGHQGESDKAESLPPEQRQREIERTLVDEGIQEPVAKEIAARTVDNGLKYVFAEADLETPAFFSVKPRGGSIVITLNTNHPAYHSLVEVLEKDQDSTSGENGAQRMGTALDGLKLLLMAWARYEDEQPDGPRRAQAQEVRVDWGRIARQFLRDS
jgi:hypothetical protein